MVAAGLLGGAGAFGEAGQWLVPPATLAILWIAVRHRCPTHLPRRLSPPETARGPDERVVAVEMRREEVLFGWDVGILWFERGGVGFVGHTVSFVLPRSLMARPPALAPQGLALQAPMWTAEVGAVTVGIVPLSGSLDAHMTVARIEALPETALSEVVVPPIVAHPDLLRRADIVRRRSTLLSSLAAIDALLIFLPATHLSVKPPLAFFVSLACGVVVLGITVLGGPALPAPVRRWLPEATKRSA